jgi:hypothetical protein
VKLYFNSEIYNLVWKNIVNFIIWDFTTEVGNSINKTEISEKYAKIQSMSFASEVGLLHISQILWFYVLTYGKIYCCLPLPVIVTVFGQWIFVFVLNPLDVSNVYKTAQKGNTKSKNKQTNKNKKTKMLAKARLCIPGLHLPHRNFCLYWPLCISYLKFG